MQNMVNKCFLELLLFVVQTMAIHAAMRPTRGAQPEISAPVAARTVESIGMLALLVTQFGEVFCDLELISSRLNYIIKGHVIQIRTFSGRLPLSKKLG